MPLHPCVYCCLAHWQLLRLRYSIVHVAAPLWFVHYRLVILRESTIKLVPRVMMLPVYTIASSKIAVAICVALVCAGNLAQRSTSDIQRAYDAAPGPPAKGAVQEEGPPSAPPAPGPSSGLKSCL